MAPKRQHFIPRLHLKHFIGTSPKGQVWTYDAQTGAVRSATPENTAVESHFYSAESADGTKDTRVEEMLADVEDKASRLYEGLLTGRVPKQAEDRADFALFLALMYTRTPAMRRMSGELYGRFVQIMTFAYAVDDRSFESLTRRVEKERGEPIDPATKELVRQAMIDPTGYQFNVSKEATLQALAAADRLANILARMKWSLAFAVEGEFITSDNPLVREIDPKTYHPVYGDHGFLNRTAEVTFPLSSKIVIIMTWDEDVIELGAFEGEHVHILNRIRAARSDRYLYANKRSDEIASLAAQYRDSRPNWTTQGFGPREFGKIQVVRKLGKRTDPDRH